MPWCGVAAVLAVPRVPRGSPALAPRAKAWGFALGLFGGKWGWGLAVVVQLSRQPQALAGEDQGRNEQETLIFFFYCCFVFLAWKGPVAFCKTTSPTLPGLGLAHREPEGRRRCWWLGGLQTA